ncbi:MAG: homoserine kinase [Panacagrimonas sp.]
MSVFTKVSQSELETFLRQYPLGQVIGFQGIGEGVENTNYFVDTRDGRWVLTLFERLNYDDLPFFLGLMDHLATHGLPCAMPLRAKDGRNLLQLNGKPAALVQRLSGQSVLFPSLAQCEAVGEALSKLHLGARSFPGHAQNTRGTQWRHDTAQQLLPQLEASDQDLIRDELQAQSALDFSALPQGVIHADLFRDNVLFVDQRLTGLIDFYYACNDALIYDLAITVNDWCTDASGHINPARAQAMIRAYCANRQPQGVELDAWPLVLRAAALRFYLSRLFDGLFPRDGGLVHVKDPNAYRNILTHLREARLPALSA